MQWLTRQKVNYKRSPPGRSEPRVDSASAKGRGGFLIPGIQHIMDESEKLEIETRIVGVLKSIFDPEIPVNIYDLGLIYNINLDDDHIAHITMTLTAPNCPMADELVEEVKYKVGGTLGVKDIDLKLTFNPRWDKSMLSDEAKLELGFL